MGKFSGNGAKFRSRLGITGEGTPRLDLENERCRLAARLAVAEELERRRIAAGLHDRVGQTLALLRMRLTRLPPGGSCAEHREVLSLLDCAIRETRTLTFELSAAELHELGLEAAVSSLADRITARADLRVRVSNDDKPKPLSLEGSIVTYRIVRELLVNAVKHARATSVDVSMTRRSRWLRIVVNDHGRGFDPYSAKWRLSELGGFGLFSARRQVADIGGRLNIDSAPGRGTHAALLVPLAFT